MDFLPGMPEILIGIVTFFIVAWYLSKREISGIPPGPSFLPIIGNFWDLRRYRGKRHIYCEELKKKYGNVFRIYFGSRLMIFLNDFESINECFVKQKDNFSSRPSQEMHIVRKSLRGGQGVIWSNGPIWKAARRFSIHSMRDLGVGKSLLEEKMRDEADYLIDNISQYNGKLFSIREVLLKATTNVISYVVFGKRFSYDSQVLEELIPLLEKAFKSDAHFSAIHEFRILSHIPSVAKTMLHMQNAIRYINDYASKEIGEHKQSFCDENIRDLIDVVLANAENPKSEQISNADLKRSVVDFFLAGSETTTNALEWVFLFLILNPDIQAKCHKEIEEVIGPNRKVTYADKPNMPYVDATILEVQRLRNSVPFSITHKAERDTMVNGYLIPAGSYIIANLHACHTDSRYWKDPFTFNPERFLSIDGKSVKRVPYLIPFSTGPRICAGEMLAKEELFLFLVGILQRFELSKVNGEVLDTDGYFGSTFSPPPFNLHAHMRS